MFYKKFKNKYLLNKLTSIFYRDYLDFGYNRGIFQIGSIRN